MRTTTSLLAISLLGGVIGTATVGAQQAGAPGQSEPSIRSVDPSYSKSMERLMQAAQQLRESIQAMATEPVGEGRNKAIKQAHEALIDTQRAMLDLPQELITTGGPHTNYSESMDKLLKAAQKLRESVQAMAQQPAGPKRNEAMDQAREALLETQQAMIYLPPELRRAQ